MKRSVNHPSSFGGQLAAVSGWPQVSAAPSSMSSLRRSIGSGRSIRLHRCLTAMVFLLAASQGVIWAAEPSVRNVNGIPAVVTTETIHGLRGFAEPLIPIGGASTGEENAALARAHESYQAKGVTGDVEPLLGFLKAFPNSPWRASVLTNVGVAYLHTGQVTKGLNALESAWAFSKAATSPSERGLADRAYAELAELYFRMGRVNQVQALLKEGEGRALLGSSSVRIFFVRQALGAQQQGENGFSCGPIGLNVIREAMGLPYQPEIFKAPSNQKGTNLVQNLALSKELGLGFQMAKRQQGAEILLPSLIHWKYDHFTAVVKREGDRFLVKDPTFDKEIWVTKGILDEETTGYALVAKGILPEGWAPVTEAEGRKIWGTIPGNTTTAAPGPGGESQPPEPPCGGMPVYELSKPHLALMIRDTPLSYSPPRGEAVAFTLAYFQFNSYQPQTMNYSNLGAKWNFNWIKYITDDPVKPGSNVTLFNEIGGQRAYNGYSAITRSFANEFKNHDQLTLNLDKTYTRVFPDGSSEVYGRSDGSATYPRRLFRTQQIDSAGNKLTFGYDAQLRLVSVTDPLGQVTNLTYGLASDPFKVTKVTDPFNRTAVLTYANSLLASITDSMGMTSSFSYGPTPLSPSAAADFVNAITTPYGTSKFKASGSLSDVVTPLWLEAQDPLGNRERLEYFNQYYDDASVSPEILDRDPNPPQGIDDYRNVNLRSRNHFYWGKRAMALFPGDYTKAQEFRYLHAFPLFPNPHTCDVWDTSRQPLENRIWKIFPNQQLIADAGKMEYSVVGSGSDPSEIVRLLDDGSTQRTLFEYNPWGKVTKRTDPAGRIAAFKYSVDGLDLLEVRNTTGTRNELVASYTYDPLDPPHRPRSYTDASGQATQFNYNAFGQITSVTNSKNEKTTFTYDLAGYLTRIAGPMLGANLDFTYDLAGRVRTATRSDGYVLTYDYDAMNRITKVTYPDATYELKAYDKLDVAASRDRAGAVTLFTHNALGQLTEVLDPMGRLTRLDWCACGDLEGLLDPNGNLTSWFRDVQGRVVTKIFPGLTRTTTSYDGQGQIKQQTDAMGQASQFAYDIVGNLLEESYPNAQVPTPKVTFTYDPSFNRLSSVTDGTGLTSFTYNPITPTPTLGAGRLARVTGPLANSAIAYGYDELGRVVSRSVNGVARTRVFDALGRVVKTTNTLGAFTTAYDGLTDRLLSLTYPSLQKTLYTYAGNLGDRRLTGIQNLKSTNANISTFGYTFDLKGWIATFSQRADAATANTTTFGYDTTDQVTSAVLKNSLGGILNQYTYGYDPAGNRDSEGINAATTTSSFDGLNRLISQRYALNTAPIRVQGEGEDKGTTTPADHPRTKAPLRPPVHALPAPPVAAPRSRR